ncbi:Gp37-like protein [Promicromonospora iranensis]|uniref:Gp28/Gp37-like domain-containing protein n=1 Tax=Promicromonospora iranensis TaxID=1105144 RepID=A0ABU2CV28_9MICO|nr:hypothetical protein [Promicromonospora iranensis]MDR7385203.1 hypothetical protein [Promicromonospora iranensis]
MTWRITPRDADLGRTHAQLAGWTELELVERYNQPCTWVLEGPSSVLRVFTAGTGCILHDGDYQVASGQARLFDRRTEYAGNRLQDTMTVGFVEDTRDLWTRLCYPDPAHPLTSTPSTFATAYDTRTDSREDLILGYTADNLGPDALVASRRLAQLVLPVSLGRGGTTTRKARMEKLGDLVAGLGEGWGRVRIVHDEATGTPRLLMKIDTVQDLSADVVFGSPGVARAAGYFKRWGYTLADPEMTDAIGFDANEKVARQATRVSSAAAISLWKRRTEVLVDQSETDDTAQILDALNEKLAEGATPTSVEFTVSAGGDLRYRRDYNVGSRVGVEIPDLPHEVSDNTIREVITKVRRGESGKPSLVIGTPGAERRSNKGAARLNKALLRIAKMERSR